MLSVYYNLLNYIWILQNHEVKHVDEKYENAVLQKLLSVLVYLNVHEACISCDCCMEMGQIGD